MSSHWRYGVGLAFSGPHIDVSIPKQVTFGMCDSQGCNTLAWSVDPVGDISLLGL